jgi:hypothetical protein
MSMWPCTHGSASLGLGQSSSDDSGIGGAGGGATSHHRAVAAEPSLWWDGGDIESASKTPSGFWMSDDKQLEI